MNYAHSWGSPDGREADSGRGAAGLSIFSASAVAHARGTSARHTVKPELVTGRSKDPAAVERSAGEARRRAGSPPVARPTAPQLADNTRPACGAASEVHTGRGHGLWSGPPCAGRGRPIACGIGATGIADSSVRFGRPAASWLPVGLSARLRRSAAIATSTCPMRRAKVASSYWRIALMNRVAALDMARPPRWLGDRAARALVPRPIVLGEKQFSQSQPRIRYRETPRQPCGRFSDPNCNLIEVFPIRLSRRVQAIEQIGAFGFVEGFQCAHTTIW